MMYYSHRNIPNDCRYLMRNHRGQKEFSHFLNAGEKNCKPRILYLAKMFFRNVDKIKAFTSEGKLRINCQQICSKIIINKELFGQKRNDTRRKIEISGKKEK